ncbi:MAG: hypothetical protein WCL41_11465, partial [Betaproteobacteria bacterium]
IEGNVAEAVNRTSFIVLNSLKARLNNYSLFTLARRTSGPKNNCPSLTRVARSLVAPPKTVHFDIYFCNFIVEDFSSKRPLIACA